MKSSPVRRRGCRPALEHLEARDVPATILVSSPADSGEHTLRQAILDSNSSVGVHDLITFDLAADSRTITLSSALPVINDPVTIDGTSQAGYAGSPLVELNGGTGPSFTGLEITAGDSTVRGLSLTHFTSTATSPPAALVFSGNGGDVAEGNWIGMRPDGTLDPNAVGIWLKSSDNRVGGDTAAARNVISTNTYGVRVGDGTTTVSGNVILGNYLGTTSDGSAVARPFIGFVYSLSGIWLTNANNTIVGRPGAGNVISFGTGSSYSGAVVVSGSSNGNIIQANQIGLAADGVTVLGNGGAGVSFGNTFLLGQQQGGTQVKNLVGGTNPGEGNQIAGGAVGVSIGADTFFFNATPQLTSGISVLGNSIYNNSQGGFTLGTNPVNDPGDADSGANGGQNYPVITSVTAGPSSTTVAGTLNSKPNTTYRLEFFVSSRPDANGFGQGRTFLGATSVTTDDQGDAAYEVTLPAAVALTDPLTTTATDPDGNTSGFSHVSHGLILTPPPIGIGQFPSLNESGGSLQLTISLLSRPTADVTVTAVSSDTTEASVSAPLTFTPDNWNVPQAFTVTGVDDDLVDGPQNVTVSINESSADQRYVGTNVASYFTTNQDNETIVVSGFVQTSEAGTTSKFTVALGTAPTADVTVSFTGLDVTEHSLSVNSLTFTPANWNVPQTVTVTGVDDSDPDGTVSYQLTPVAASADRRFQGLQGTPVFMSNTDDDLLVLSTNSLTVTEGDSASITAKLARAPSQSVTLSFPFDPLTVSPATLTFTPANWNTPQTVTFTPRDDTFAQRQRPQTVTLFLNGFTSADSTQEPFTLTVVDNDPGLLTYFPDDAQGQPVYTGFTTEGGGTLQVFVVLSTQPSADVTVPVASYNYPSFTEGEGRPDVSSLVFTPANWNVPQVVTLTGQDDTVADGDASYYLVFGTSTSADTNYDARTTATSLLTNLDDEPGVHFGFTGGFASVSTTETPTSFPTTFTVVLQSAPTADVVVPLASSDTTEGTVSPSSLTFTPANWNVPQTVTVTGVDDAEVDGSVNYVITVGPLTSDDPAYNGLDPNDVQASNFDNDGSGGSSNPFVISALSGQTSESGGQFQFTVKLSNAPSFSSVILPIISTDTTEGTVDVSSLTFTSDNWNVPQTVTVTGVNDGVADGDVYFAVKLGPATGDFTFSGRSGPDVIVRNVDDEAAPGVTVSPTSGLMTTEAGGMDSFTVVLRTQPTADVTITLSVSDATEGTLDKTSLTFTAADWDVPQTVTVSGVDDKVEDGNVLYTVVTSASSADAAYNGVFVADVSVTNADDDVAGVSVMPTSGLLTSEAGGQATFTVVLTSQPTANVTVTLASSDTTEGTVSSPMVTFTSANWNVPQTVTVTGVDDDLTDGDVTYTVVTAATSADVKYDGIAVADVAVTNADNDVPGVTVTPTSGLLTTEAGGQATFTVVLKAEPTADVLVTITSSETTEGTVSQSMLTFTTANWNVAQTVTVTGVDDQLDDGDVQYVIMTTASSADANYDGIDVADVSVTNTDDDTAGVTVSKTSLTTTEAGGMDSFTVVLTSQPTADVTITLSGLDATEGMLSQSMLTFTATDWNVAQTVTVTGLDDVDQDGDVQYVIMTTATSTDANYDGIDVADVSVTNADDDTPGVAVTPASLNTTEAGGFGSFSVVLKSQPTADVTITLSGLDATEGMLSQSMLTFTTANWNVAQTVTVTGVDDQLDDGDVQYVIMTTATSADANYDGIDVADVSVTNADDDTAGVMVSKTSLTTTEAGGMDSFTVVLTSQPTADVTITLSGLDATEGALSKTSLTFTAADWNVAQTVTVTGVDDAVDDGNVQYVIATSASSADPTYNNIVVADVSVTNADDDTAGVTVTPTAGLKTTEAGGTATFAVVLTSQPTANVTVSLSVSDATEGTINKASLTFTAANYNTPQTVTVTGVNDALDDGDVAYVVVVGPTTSADVVYAAIDPADVNVTNLDDDAMTTLPPVFATPQPGGLIVIRAGGTGEIVGTVTPFVGYLGALNAATGDVNHDGTPDYVVATAGGVSGHVKVIDGATGAELHSFFAFGADYLGGLSVASADVNGDGFADVVVGAGPGAPGGHVKVFDGRTGTLLRSFFAFPGFDGGVSVAVGDVDGDGDADLVVGAGAGAPNGHVKAFDFDSLAEVRSFFAFTGFSSGISVAVGDVDSDGAAEIIAGTLTGPSHVKVFDGRTGAELRSFLAFTDSAANGARPIAVDVLGDGDADLLVFTGDRRFHVFDGRSLELLDSLFTALAR